MRPLGCKQCREGLCTIEQSKWTYPQGIAMFIRKLTYLVALAQERHFGRAAARCFVSQPALSGAIQSLEQELGVSIVQRGGNRFQGLTTDGQRILAWAQRILADCDHLRQEVKSGRGADLEGALIIGAIPATLPLVAKMVHHVLRAFPRVRHEIRTYSAAKIQRRLANYEIDLGISYLDDRRLQEFSTVPVFCERYVLVYSSRQASADVLAEDTEQVTWGQAARLPLCLFTDNLQCRQGMNAAFANAGAEAAPVVETDSLTVLLGHVIHAGLYSILPHSILCHGIFHDQNQPLVVRPMESLRREIGLVVRREKPHGKVLEAVLQHLQTLDLQEWADHMLERESQLVS